MARDRRDEYDDEDDTPRKRRRDDDDDDPEERPARRRRDEEEDEAPAPRRRAARDDDDDDRPRRRTARGDGGSSRGQKLNVFGLISMILGIVGIIVTVVFGCCYGWIVGIVFGVVSLILGLVGMSAAKKSDGQMGGGMALAGTILSVITIIFAILWVVFIAAMFGLAASLPTSVNTGNISSVGPAGGPVSATDPVGATVTADQMWMEFRDDPTGADVKYGGKIVQVTGMIDRVIPGGAVIDAEVRLKGTGRSLVDCVFGPNRLAAVAGLTTGQTVTIRGRYDSHSPSGPKLKDCILMPGGGGADGAAAGALKVNAIALAKEFMANPVGANAKYGNKTLEITGVVHSLVVDDPETPTVYLGQRTKEVECRFAKGAMKQGSGVIPGKTVTFRGKCVGDEDGLVVIEECTVVK
jgi:hypothetical protein